MLDSLLPLQDGKHVWHGVAKQVSGPGAAGAAAAAFKKRLCEASKSFAQKRSGKKQEEEADDDECEDTVRFELNSLLAEADQQIPAAKFRCGAGGKVGTARAQRFLDRALAKTGAACDVLHMAHVLGF